MASSSNQPRIGSWDTQQQRWEPSRNNDRQKQQLTYKQKQGSALRASRKLMKQAVEILSDETIQQETRETILHEARQIWEQLGMSGSNSFHPQQQRYQQQSLIDNENEDIDESNSIIDDEEIEQANRDNADNEFGRGAFRIGPHWSNDFYNNNSYPLPSYLPTRSDDTASIMETLASQFSTPGGSGGREYADSVNNNTKRKFPLQKTFQFRRNQFNGGDNNSAPPKGLLRRRRRGKDALVAASNASSHGTAMGAPGTKTDSFAAAGSSTADGWMCGVCGRIYSSFDAAERHEQICIRNVVASLGWTFEGTTMQPPTAPSSWSTNVSTSMSQVEGRWGVETSTTRTKTTSIPTTSRTIVGQRRPISYSGMDDAIENKTSLASPTQTLGNEKASTPDPIEDATTTYNDNASQFAADLPEGILVPKPRARTNSEVRFDPSVDKGTGYRNSNNNNNKARMTTGTLSTDPLLTGDDDLLDDCQQEDDALLLMSNAMRETMAYTDEALVHACKLAEPFILSQTEREAERELALLARDKRFYDDIAQRAFSRQRNANNKYRTRGRTLLGKIQNKFVDAYQLMKEGNVNHGVTDQYTRRPKKGEDASPAFNHMDETLYVNVMVRNSVQVVRNELERLASKRWERADEAQKYTQFQRFRSLAHINIVRLARIALASDLTPRRIAVQLSNDFYRLLTPRLKRRGVRIETEIEYRVGPYFVLAVNILSIDWRRLIKTNHRDVMLRKARWKRETKEADEEQEEDSKDKGFMQRILVTWDRLNETSVYDVIAKILAWLYHFHWIVYLPICWVSYHCFLGAAIRHFIISSVTDEVFLIVEEKGMEMEIKVSRAEKQAAFMLSALRELRADGQELEKKRQATESEEKGQTLGPLLGPAIKEDKGPAVKPPGFEVPPNLEFVGLELDLPVGFRRLRWAMLSTQSKFIVEALYKNEAKFENVTTGEWSKYNEYIGMPNLPEGVNPEDFIGAEKEGSQLMPRSAFVSANMCYETWFLIAYNDYCFCFKKRARNPDAPFGKTFVAWTQFCVVNCGNDYCHLTCSVEAEFPGGEPMVARQIRSGMRAGTGEMFVLIGETITKYADEFP